MARIFGLGGEVGGGVPVSPSPTSQRSRAADLPRPAKRRAAQSNLGTAGLALVFGLAALPGSVVNAAERHGPDRWQKVPTVSYTLNNKQDAIAFADNTVGLYGNGTGAIYRTVDGGRHWALAWRKPGTYVRTLEFIDARTAVMGNVGPDYFPNVTDRQALYISHDQGTTWSPIGAQTGPAVMGSARWMSSRSPASPRRCGPAAAWVALRP